MALWPNRACSQVTSPTIVWRLAVWRVRLCSCLEKSNCWFDLQLWRGHRTTPLLRRKWMKDQLWEGWPRRCQHRGETNAASFRTSHSNGENSQSRSSPVPPSKGRPVSMSSDKGRSGRDLNDLQESYSEREREENLSEHREIRDFLELPADHVQGEKAAVSRLSKSKNHTRLLLEEQKSHILSEARSELYMQELWVESADRVLHESDLLLHPQRMEFCRATQSPDSRRDDWLCTESEERERKSQRKGQSQVVIQHSDPHERPMLQNLRTV